MIKRITIVLSLLISLIIITSGIISFFIFKNSYMNEKKIELKNQANYIKTALLPEYIKTKEINPLVQFAKSTGSRISLIDPDGNVSFDSYDNLVSPANHSNREEVKKAFDGADSYELRYSNTTKTDMLYYTIPYKEKGEFYYILRLSLPTSIFNSVGYDLTNHLVYLSLLSVFIVLVINAWILIKEMHPLDDVVQFAKEIKRGNYKERLLMLRSDQIGDLAESLNQMAEQLESSFNSINQANVELSSVLKNINHGILAIDNRHKIILINANARKIIGIDTKQPLKGVSLFEICHGAFIVEIQRNLVKNGKKHFESELVLEDKTYQVVCAPMITEEKDEKNCGVIIMIEDRTEIKQVDKIRRDFIANVTHELKTPITTIRGFSETILVNKITDEKTLEHFNEIILMECGRLTRLIEDILILSHLENRQSFQEKQVEEIDVYDEIEQVFHLLEAYANEKNIKLHNFCDLDIIIKLIPDQFRELLINIIDNAIKYSNENKNVEVHVLKESEGIQITIKDEGQGISDEDLPEIFKRFYRADKSHSQEQKGTGLGLAIVKHIVQNNGGSITVNSELGKGSTFIINFPNKNVI